jgi:hypothetical protein
MMGPRLSQSRQIRLRFRSGDNGRSHRGQIRSVKGFHSANDDFYARQRVLHGHRLIAFGLI